MNVKTVHTFQKQKYSNLFINRALHREQKQSYRNLGGLFRQWLSILFDSLRQQLWDDGPQGAITVRLSFCKA